MSKTDAFQIKKLREAGAIMLAKSNMAEFAFDPMETVNSLMPGYTRNPYALDRVTAGSSGKITQEDINTAVRSLQPVPITER